MKSNSLYGNWNVRQFSLDKNDPADNMNDDDIIANHVSVTTIVNSIANDNDNLNDIVVGRRDGSTFWTMLGNDYLSSFA